MEEGPVVLVGHSLGGLVALLIALAGRADVRGVVLIGSMGLSPVILAPARLYHRAGPERLARIGALFGRGSSSGRIDRLRRELYLVRGGRPLPSAAFDRLVPLVGGAYHLGDRLAELRVPTLLLWGERDDAFPLPVAMQAAARIPAAELVVLPAEHCPHLDMPAACLEHVLPFLEKLSVSGAAE
jgi:pimeloyl-ACP methyl ester carboxylesterase